MVSPLIAYAAEIEHAARLARAERAWVVAELEHAAPPVGRWAWLGALIGRLMRRSGAGARARRRAAHPVQ